MFCYSIPEDIQNCSHITTKSWQFFRCKSKWGSCKIVAPSQPFLQNFHDLLVFVRWKNKSVAAHPRVDPPWQLLRKIHGVGNNDESQFGSNLRSPLKEIIEYLLVLGQQKVYLVNHYNMSFFKRNQPLLNSIAEDPLTNFLLTGNDVPDGPVDMFRLFQAQSIDETWFHFPAVIFGVTVDNLKGGCCFTNSRNPRYVYVSTHLHRTLWLILFRRQSSTKLLMTCFYSSLPTMHSGI